MTTINLQRSLPASDSRRGTAPLRLNRIRLETLLHLLHVTGARPAEELAEPLLDRLEKLAPATDGPTVEFARPVELLADLLTVSDHVARPLTQVALCYVGDGRDDSARSLLLAGALLGMDVRLAAPPSMWPPEDVIVRAEDLAPAGGATLLITSDAGHAVLGADVVVAGAWPGGSVLAADAVAPPAFVVDEDFLASSGVVDTATLVARLRGRDLANAPRSLTHEQLNHRRRVAEALAV